MLPSQSHAEGLSWHGWWHTAGIKMMLIAWLSGLDRLGDHKWIIVDQ